MSDGQQVHVTVRVCADPDVPVVAEILRAVHEMDGYPVEGVDDPVAWISSATIVRSWVAEINGRVVGHVSVSEPGDGDAALLRCADRREKVAVLGRLFVAPDARGQSVGRELVLAATEHARKRGVRLVLEVLDKDRAAIRLYERLGWHRIGSALHDGGGSLFPAHCYRSPDRR